MIHKVTVIILKCCLLSNEVLKEKKNSPENRNAVFQLIDFKCLIKLFYLVISNVNLYTKLQMNKVWAWPGSLLYYIIIKHKNYIRTKVVCTED